MRSVTPRRAVARFVPRCRATLARPTMDHRLSDRVWRRCMGVEPTHDRTCGQATVLKTARPTGTLPPPRRRRGARKHSPNTSPPPAHDQTIGTTTPFRTYLLEREAGKRRLR